MKIALIGDYSGVHLSLKKGFQLLGHEADIYSDGDGFKKIRSDKVLHRSFSSEIDKLRFYFYELPALLKNISVKYDAIQMMNPHVIQTVRNSPAYYHYLMSILKRCHGIKSLAVVGCEKNTQRGISSLPRSPCEGCLKDSNLTRCVFVNNSNSKIADHAVDFADVILPMGAPVYAESYGQEAKAAPLLPFPVDASLVPYVGNKLGKKIRVLHGVSRGGFKGSELIIAALSKVQKNFPDQFEILIIEKLAFDDYIELLTTVNIVVDQLYGNGLGMNALVSMAAGCVVITHFDRVNVGELNLSNAPAIQIGSNSDDLFEQISSFKSWTANDFEHQGEISRKYVEENCSPVKVASRVLSIWEMAQRAKDNLMAKGFA